MPGGGRMVMDKLIESYEVQMVAPGCMPGSALWGAQASLSRDISIVFPYLNAILDDAWYDHQNQILIWGDERQKYAFRPCEIRVAQVKDPMEACEIVNKMVDRVNQVWQERDNITPRFTERRLPAVLDILRLLPRTNCKRCGYPTCTAYSAALRKNQAQLEQCLPLLQPEYAENREAILNLISSD